MSWLTFWSIHISPDMTRRIAVARDGGELCLGKMPDAPSFKAMEDSGAPSSCYHQDLASISGVAGCHNKLSAMIPDVEIQQKSFPRECLAGSTRLRGTCRSCRQLQNQVPTSEGG
jgi:hypothetical protein